MFPEGCKFFFPVAAGFTYPFFLIDRSVPAVKNRGETTRPTSDAR